MKTEKIITAKTAAEIKAFNVTSNSPQTIIANGLAGVETIPIEIWDGDAWEAVGFEGVATELGVLHNPIVVIGPGEFRINKGITAGPVSISICNEHKN